MEEKGCPLLHETQDEGEELYEDTSNQDESTGTTDIREFGIYRKKYKKGIRGQSLFTFFSKRLEEMCKIVQSWFSSRPSAPDRLIIKIPRHSMEELEYDNL